MLGPSHVCVLVDVNQRGLQIPAEQAGYGVLSGTTYPSGTHKVDKRDSDGKILLYWQTFPVIARTTFLGPIPSPENVFEVEIRAEFSVEKPLSLYQYRLRDGEMLSVETFSQDAANHIRSLLNRLACEFSPMELLSTAKLEAQNRILDGLENVYQLEGIVPKAVILSKVDNLVKGKELEFLLKKIEVDAQEQEIALEQAYQREREQIDHAAQQGDIQAQTIVAQLNGIHSVVELQNKTLPQSTSQKQSSVTINTDKPEATVVTTPIVMASKGQISGRFAVLSQKHPPRYYEILRPWFNLGRDQNCHVCLPSPTISSLHCSVARIGSGLSVVDCHSSNGTYYNAERLHQRFLQTGDVLRLEDHWIVLKLEPSQEFQAIDHTFRGTIASSGQTLARTGNQMPSFNADVSAMQANALVRLVSSSGQIASSDSQPLLIGHDSACELCLAGGGIARFHAVVFWDIEYDANGRICNAGIYVEDLHSGRGTLLNGHPVSHAKIKDGDVLEVGGHRITITLTGDCSRHAKDLVAKHSPVHGLAITCIEGPGAGETHILTTRKNPLVLGSGDDCDLRLPSGEVSRRHAEIHSQLTDGETNADRVVLSITDLKSTNGTYVNGGELKSGRPKSIHPGDIIRLSGGEGHCDLLVHYDL